MLIDVVSGDIRPLEWKKGTTDTLELLPVTDSILAIADADYFDWPVLPEAPSSLNLALAGKSVKLSWQVHGGDPAHVLVERRVEMPSKSAWERVAELGPTASEYSDARVQNGQQVAYRVRASNADGVSAYSNIARITLGSR